MDELRTTADDLAELPILHHLNTLVDLTFLGRIIRRIDLDCCSRECLLVARLYASARLTTSTGRNALELEQIVDILQ